MITHKQMVQAVIEALEEANFTTGDCNGRALVELLKEYRTNLPEFNDYFHKKFEAGEVSKSKRIDKAMWYLIRTNQTFWNTFERVKRSNYND